LLNIADFLAYNVNDLLPKTIYEFFNQHSLFCF